MSALFRAFRMAAVMMVAAMGLVSCAEDTVESDPYANWEKRNVEFIDSIASVAANPPEGEIWEAYLRYDISFEEKPEDLLDPYTPENKDYVYVKYVSEEDIPADGEQFIMYNDTVSAAYQGFLINGTRFDGNYSGTFDPEVNDNFTKFGVSEVITGWTVALLHMKPEAKGAAEVYIPYELGYGTTGSGSSIPGYSALKFEMYVDEVIKPQLQE